MKITKKQLKIGIGVVVAVNAIIIIGIMVWIGNKTSNGKDNVKELIVSTPDASGNISTGENMENKSLSNEEDKLFKKEEPKLSEEENYQVIYKAIIPGTYETEEGYVFIFKTNGTFDGYFNEENPNVKNYNYDVKGKIGVDSNIKISDPTYTESELYPLEFTSDGEILMYYSEDKFIELGI